MIPGFSAENAVEQTSRDYALRRQWSGTHASAVTPAASWGFCSELCYRVCKSGAESECWYDCMMICSWIPIALSRF